MKQVDYIIVGLGIAGLCFAERLLQQGKTFVLIADGKHGATAASGGVLNPTVLKRFTLAWNAPEFFQEAHPFYSTIGERLQTTIIDPIPISRIFNAVEEQNNWMVASDKRELERYLGPITRHNDNPNLRAPLGMGAVTGGAIMNPRLLLKSYSDYLRDASVLREEAFDHHRLQFSESALHYKDIVCEQIVFAEGAEVRNNPFFTLDLAAVNKQVFVANKGQYTIFRAPALRLKSVVKGPMMLIPLGDDCYKIGATYNRDVYTNNPTKEDSEALETKLKKMIRCEFEVLDQVAGVRPTVKDRKPLLGAFDTHPNLYFLNGLGTRGLSMAPLLSKWLYEAVEKGKPLPPAVDINRFSAV